MATVFLNRSEDWFWKSTPRIIISLIEQWKLISGKSENGTGETVEQGLPVKDVISSQDFMLL